MSQLRKDPVTKRWVIIAPERPLPPLAGRAVKGMGPDQAAAAEAAAAPDPQSSPGASKCPFCPGSEASTPPEVLAYRGRQGWEIRVVPNKFPALRIEGKLERSGEGIYDRMSGIGAHEVIIEHPSHFATFDSYSEHDVQRILWSYRDRSLDLKKDPRFKYLLVFRNSGSAAGASLEHPHSQLIATPVIPRRVSEELDGASVYFSFKDRCVYCDMIGQERRSGKRLVMENDFFVVVCPFASRFPYELMILPRDHHPDFDALEPVRAQALAKVLRSSIQLLTAELGGAAYNYVIHSAPVNGPRYDGFHWHLEIIPRLTPMAGFEWGTGFYVNPVAPEEACRRLKERMG